MPRRRKAVFAGAFVDGFRKPASIPATFERSTLARSASFSWLQRSDAHAWSTFDLHSAPTNTEAERQQIQSKGRESHVYEKAGGARRIVQLHYSDLQPGQTQ